LTDLHRRSIDVILGGQADTGAYVASPSFPPYAYCWFRDGAFIADAMSRVGEVESAERFFAWCDRTIRRHYPDLHTRYTVDGEPGADEWSNFQLDGFGTWVWALHAHAARHGRSVAPFDEGAELSLRFAADNWRRPSYDWWEEREGTHAATLACLHAGLAARDHPLAAEVGEEARAAAPGRLDASLLCLFAPFGLLDRGDALLGRIEERLVDPSGGVHRHEDDEYYGGGAWVLLTAWLGWADPGRAAQALAWTESRATPEGHLPEQVAEHLLRPERLEPWERRWGPSASPLLWSHAMYLTLRAATSA
jgi:GH15 family glucan-1,4-alpha-glucosidase